MDDDARLEKESTVALFKQIESDVKTCLEKDLDTNEELKKQKAFNNNFTAMLDFLGKLKAPGGMQDDVKVILKLLGEWDVYAYWFKEMKDLVGKIKEFQASFTSYAENTGLFPKAEKPVEKPGTPAPVKPVAPSLLKPIVLGAAQQKPSTPSLPPITVAAKPATTPEKAPPSETKERAVPLLKPVFKIPPVKMPLATTAQPSPAPLKPVVPPLQAVKPESPPVIDESAAPVPLKALVDEKKLEIHVKPVKLIKPIMAVQQPIPVAVEAQRTAEPPAKPAVPTLGSKAPVPAAPQPATPPARKPSSDSGQKPAGTDKPLLIPKPIKIVVPDLDKINLGDEIRGEALDAVPSKTTPSASGNEDDMFSEMNVIEGSIPVKTQPARVVKPIPVKITASKAAPLDPNDAIVDTVVAKVSQRLDSRRLPGQAGPGTPVQQGSTQKAPVPAMPQAPPEDEYITPMEVLPEDMDGWAQEDESKPVKVVKLAKPAAPKKKDVVEMLDAADSWDDEHIASILDEAISEGASNGSIAANSKGKAPGPVTLNPAMSKADPEPQINVSGDANLDVNYPTEPGLEEGVDGQGTSIGVMDQEPKKSRLHGIKKQEPPMAGAAKVAGPAPVDSMSLFMGGLGSKRGDKTPPSPSPNLSMFRPALGGEAPAPATANTPAARKGDKLQHVAPIGSDVDVETLPDTKDGLYQALIALEGKRYAIERARKDLRADLDKGIIKPPAYDQKLADLKAEMDKIADKIKEIREKIKKFK